MAHYTSASGFLKIWGMPFIIRLDPVSIVKRRLFCCNADRSPCGRLTVLRSTVKPTYISGTEQSVHNKKKLRNPPSRLLGMIDGMTDVNTQDAAVQGEEPHPVDFSRITAICGIGTAGIGILGILGLYLSLPLFSGIIPGYKPISFSAALIWIFLGLVLAGIAKKPLQGVPRTVIAGALLLVIFTQLVEFPQNMLGDHGFIEHQTVQTSSALLGVPTTPISPVTSGLILPACLGLLILLFAPWLSEKHPRIRDVSGIIGILVSFMSFIFILSYLYGSPFFYRSQILPITFPSALALFVLGLGLGTAAGASAVPLKYFTGTSTRAQLLRVFIPLTLAIILFDELLHIVLTSYGKVNNALVLALIISVFTLVTIIVVGRIAGRVSSAIDRAELKRREAEMELRAAYEQLAAQEEELHQQYDDLSRSQQALSERETQHRTILRTAMDGFCLVDLKGAFLDVNDAFCSMLGYTREEMPGLSLPDIEVRESLDAIDRHMQEIIRNGSDRFETRYRCKDGGIIDAEVSVVYTGSQQAPFFTFHRDVTERNRAQKAHDLAKKKLSLLNLVTFKDIQNVVFGLTGYMQLIKEELSDKKPAGYVDKLGDLLGRISQSLEFAHSYQDMGMKPPRWQNVNHVFLLAISHLDFSKITHRIQTGGLEIFADPLLEQAFHILAKNTLTHGGTTTQVSFTYTEMPDGCLKIVYEDNGQGIPDTMKAGIFTRDFLEKKGMGLFLVREILEITAISIQETGEPGTGTRFEITVPKDGYRFGRTQTDSG
jgi:PAS domain S-box-containing protein